MVGGDGWDQEWHLLRWWLDSIWGMTGFDLPGMVDSIWGDDSFPNLIAFVSHG